MRKNLVCLIAACVVLSVSGVAQEQPEAKKFENPKWYYMVQVKYKPGKAGDAMKMIREHFRPAAIAAETRHPKMYQHHSGRWNVTYFWHIEGGIEELDWETTARSVKWMKTFAERSGGMEKAEAILEEYRSLVADSESTLVRKIVWEEKKKEQPAGGG